jgi:hypothetical protein
VYQQTGIQGSIMPDHIDEFESMFRRAERERFSFAEIPLKTVTIITDKDAAAADDVRRRLVEYCPRLETVSDWRLVTGQQFSSVVELLAELEQNQTDLIVTWRHLQEQSLIPQHSLGVYLDVLTQTTSIPVLVMPGTSAEPKSLTDMDCDRVMVVADHISGDNRLINYAVRMCRNGGNMWLCHVEDDRVFQRYLDAIARIPEIDTSDAVELLDAQLLKDAQDFIDDCMKVLNDSGPNVSYHSVVKRGHYLRDYRKLIDDNQIDLLVANTKDDDQLAMHGVAYSLSVEMTDVAMLLL